MTKLILILALFTGLWADKHPKDVTGKWVVEHVEVPDDLAAKVPPEQKAMMTAMIQQSLNKASFNLKPDHHCSSSVNMPNTPPSGYWEYNAKLGLLKISESKEEQDRVMLITVTKVKDKIFFTLQKKKVVLTMHKE